MAVAQIQTLKVPLYEKMAESLPLQFWQTLQLERTVNWNFLAHFVSNHVKSVVVLEKDEIPILSAETIGMSSGALLLTTHRVVWLKQKTSGPNPTYKVEQDIPIEGVIGVSGDFGSEGLSWKASAKQIAFTAKSGEKKAYVFSCIEVIKPLVELAIQDRKNKLEEQRKKENVHITLDFSFLKSAMENGGVVMKVLKCPECSGNVEFPKTGNLTKCQYCGRNIYAQDIFEKIKGLL
jgi:hypothetical protein